jgi:hypothetical protein
MPTESKFYMLPVLMRKGEIPDGATVSVTQERFAVVLGSDLVLATDENDDTRLFAFDSDANPLGCIALLGDGVTVADVLPIAVQTARALFPTHLLTER